MSAPVCTHTHCFWAGISCMCPKCGMTQKTRPSNAMRELEANEREERRSIEVESYWQAKQGEDYGSY
jgi:uncharacterized Zn finger protein (UPF0148 family)